MSEWGYVVAAFGLTWLVLLAYAAYLWRRIRRADALLAQLPGAPPSAEETLP
ncbi:MAG: hypothetical protein HY561_00665 [Gemmatimonadetes bacterium]|nr:hypothetical protein [Gemmatimonadota bacterium]